MTDEPKYLTPKEAAKRLPVGNADWVREQMRSGRLEAAKVGGRWVTTPEWIDAMVQAGSNSTTRRRRRREVA